VVDVVSVSPYKPSRDYAGQRVYARHLAAIARDSHVTVLTVETEPNKIDLANVDILEVPSEPRFLRPAPAKVKKLFSIGAQVLDGLSMGIGVRKSIRSGELARLIRDADVVELHWSPLSLLPVTSARYPLMFASLRSSTKC
jgi:hypothetical protein